MIDAGDTREMSEREAAAPVKTQSQVPALRQQLSMYASGSMVERLEATRRVLDPVQFGLIPAHITLCREDEIAALPVAALERRLAEAAAAPLVLEFGRPEGFGGHGILLHCSRGESSFHALRQKVLGSERVREQRPHITLAHPRNPQAPGNDWSAALSLPASMSLTFASIHLISQRGREPWVIERTFSLRP